VTWPIAISIMARPVKELAPLREDSESFPPWEDLLPRRLPRPLLGPSLPFSVCCPLFFVRAALAVKSSTYIGMGSAGQQQQVLVPGGHVLKWRLMQRRQITTVCVAICIAGYR
jgi:hypothetical protein